MRCPQHCGQMFDDSISAACCQCPWKCLSVYPSIGTYACRVIIAFSLDNHKCRSCSYLANTNDCIYLPGTDFWQLVARLREILQHHKLFHHEWLSLHFSPWIYHMTEYSSNPSQTKIWCRETQRCHTDDLRHFQGSAFCHCHPIYSCRWIWLEHQPNTNDHLANQVLNHSANVCPCLSTADYWCHPLMQRLSSDSLPSQSNTFYPSVDTTQCYAGDAHSSWWLPCNIDHRSNTQQYAGNHCRWSKYFELCSPRKYRLVCSSQQWTMSIGEKYQKWLDGEFNGGFKLF